MPGHHTCPGREIEPPSCLFAAARAPNICVDRIEDLRHAALVNAVHPPNAFGLADSRNDQPSGRADGDRSGQSLEPASLVVASLEACEDG